MNSQTKYKTIDHKLYMINLSLQKVYSMLQGLSGEKEKEWLNKIECYGFKLEEVRLEILEKLQELKDESRNIS